LQGSCPLEHDFGTATTGKIPSEQNDLIERIMQLSKSIAPTSSSLSSSSSSSITNDDDNSNEQEYDFPEISLIDHCMMIMTLMIYQMM